MKDNRTRNAIATIKVVNRLAGKNTEETLFSEKETEWRKKGWLRHPKDFKREIVDVSVPFNRTSKKEVVINKFRYLSAPFRKENSQFRFIEREVIGEPGRFVVEGCVRTEEYTHKGIPCCKINRSPKRGGIPIDPKEFKAPKTRNVTAELTNRSSDLYLGKRVNMKNFRR